MMTIPLKSARTEKLRAPAVRWKRWIPFAAAAVLARSRLFPHAARSVPRPWW